MAILDLDLNTVYFPLNHNAPSTDSLFFWKNQGTPILKIKKVVGFKGKENFLLFKIA